MDLYKIHETGTVGEEDYSEKELWKSWAVMSLKIVLCERILSSREFIVDTRWY